MADSVVLLSGGLDSTTLVAAQAAEKARVSALFIAYGQGAIDEEESAARSVAEHYSIPLKVLRLTGLHFGDGEIRGRNAFLLHAALLAAPIKPTVVAIGIHGGVPYVDCEPPFVALHQRSFELQTGGEVQVSAPFMSLSKADIYALARSLSVPVGLTYSCERGGEPCGSCRSCLDRGALDALA